MRKITVGSGDLAFAPRNVPHTFANQSDAPAHMVITCTPEVIRVGPKIGE